MTCMCVITYGNNRLFTVRIFNLSHLCLHVISLFNSVYNHVNFYRKTCHSFFSIHLSSYLLLSGLYICKRCFIFVSNYRRRIWFSNQSSDHSLFPLFSIFTWALRRKTNNNAKLCDMRIKGELVKRKSRSSSLPAVGHHHM